MFVPDSMHVAVPHAVDSNVHEMQLTATVRLCWHRSRASDCAKRSFGTESVELAGKTAGEDRLACGRAGALDF